MRACVCVCDNSSPYFIPYFFFLFFQLHTHSQKCILVIAVGIVRTRYDFSPWSLFAILMFVGCILYASPIAYKLISSPQQMFIYLFVCNRTRIEKESETQPHKHRVCVCFVCGDFENIINVKCDVRRIRTDWREGFSLCQFLPHECVQMGFSRWIMMAFWAMKWMHAWIGKLSSWNRRDALRYNHDDDVTTLHNSNCWFISLQFWNCNCNATAISTTTTMTTMTTRENPVDWAHCSPRQWRKCFHFSFNGPEAKCASLHIVQYAKEAIPWQTFLHAICSRNRQFPASLHLAFIHCRRVDVVACSRWGWWTISRIKARLSLFSLWFVKDITTQCGLVGMFVVRWDWIQLNRNWILPFVVANYQFHNFAHKKITFSSRSINSDALLELH